MGKGKKKMAFQIIETQEQLDAVIGERVARAKETAKKEFEGFISPEKVEEMKTAHKLEIEGLTKASSETVEKISSLEKALKEKDDKIAKYESDSVKIKVANEFGLSIDAVKFIGGSDEESIRESAKALKNLVGTRVAPLADPEGKGGDSKESAYKEMLKGLTRKE